MDNEIWKDIEDYDGQYQISNTGKGKSLIWRRVVKTAQDLIKQK